MLGEPNAVTLKSKSGSNNDWIFNLGFKSHYGSLRFDGIYTFNFPSAFNSRDFELYAGVGAVLAFGDGDGIFKEKLKRKNDFGLGIKGLMGVNFKPSNKFEIFLELGPLIGLSDGIGANMELVLGFRFYP